MKLQHFDDIIEKAEQQIDSGQIWWIWAFLNQWASATLDTPPNFDS